MPPELDDILSYIPDVILDVRYASKNNFTGQQLYTQQFAWLRHEPLQQLAKVANELRENGYKLVIFDAYRPPVVQKVLRTFVNDENYVKEVSNHCRGITVDLTLAYENGSYLDMGTDYDDFTERAHPNTKNISKEQQQNREYLDDILNKYNFEVHPYEWWHYNYKPGLDWPLIQTTMNAVI